MAEEDNKRPGISVGIQPLLIEVPVLSEADLLELVAAIDDSQAAHIRLRSKARAVLRKAQAAMDRWALPPEKPKEPPPLKLVGKSNAKGRR